MIETTLTEHFYMIVTRYMFSSYHYGNIKYGCISDFQAYWKMSYFLKFWKPV